MRAPSPAPPAWSRSACRIDPALRPTSHGRLRDQLAGSSAFVAILRPLAAPAAAGRLLVEDPSLAEYLTWPSGSRVAGAGRARRYIARRSGAPTVAARATRRESSGHGNAGTLRHVHRPGLLLPRRAELRRHRSRSTQSIVGRPPPQPPLPQRSTSSPTAPPRLDLRDLAIREPQYVASQGRRQRPGPSADTGTMARPAEPGPPASTARLAWCLRVRLGDDEKYLDDPSGTSSYLTEPRILIGSCCLIVQPAQARDLRTVARSPCPGLFTPTFTSSYQAISLAGELRGRRDSTSPPTRPGLSALAPHPSYPDVDIYLPICR